MDNSFITIFDKIWPKFLYYSTGTKYMYMYQEKNYKMENSLLAIFNKIWPKSLYYSTGTLARFLSKFKNS